MALYRTESPFNSAVNALQGAAQTSASMTRETKTEYKAPEKTFGDALASGLGGAWAGLSAADYLNPGTAKSLFQSAGGLFKGAGTAEGIAAGMTMPAVQALSTGGAATLGSVASGTAGTMAGGAASGLAGGVAGSALSSTAGGLAGGAIGAMGAGGAYGGVGGALAAMPGVAALSGTAAATGATAAAAAGAATSAAGAASGAELGAAAGGAAAGPLGAGVGALLGLGAGLLSYFL